MRESTVTNRRRSAKQFPLIFCEKKLKNSKIRLFPIWTSTLSVTYMTFPELYTFCVCAVISILYYSAEPPSPSPGQIQMSINIRQSRSSDPSPQLFCPLQRWFWAMQFPLSQLNSSELQVSSTSIRKKKNRIDPPITSDDRLNISLWNFYQNF